MIVLFVYTLNDCMDSPIVINVEPIISNQYSVFPAVSVCIKKKKTYTANNERVKNFIQKYYAENNIKEPQQ